jgi:hypothetical protein
MNFGMYRAATYEIHSPQARRARYRIANNYRVSYHL